MGTMDGEPPGARRQFDAYLGVAPSASDTRQLAEEADDLTAEERELAQELDRYMKKPARGDDDAADRAFRRDYTGLGSADAVSLALRLDSLTGVRP